MATPTNLPTGFTAPAGAVIDQGNGAYTQAPNQASPAIPYPSGATQSPIPAPTTPTAPPTSGSTATTPTVADLYGTGSFEDQYNTAYANQANAYSAGGVQDIENQSRADILNQYQSQIDALNAAEAQARATITQQFAPIAAGRVGSTIAAEARGGNLGSTVSAAAIDNQNTANAQDLAAQIAKSDQQYEQQQLALNEYIGNLANNEANTRITAAQKGADAAITEIQGREARAQANAQQAVKAMILAGVVDPSNPNFNTQISNIATQFNLDPSYVQGVFNDQKAAADAAALKAQTDQATLDKNASDIALQNSEVAKNKADTEVALQGLQGTNSIADSNLPQVNMNADDTPNAAQQTAFLSSIPDQSLRTLIQGIANYQINPSSLPTRNYKGVGGLTQSQVLSLVKQYDPSFSQSEYASRQALQTNFTSGKYSQNINSLNTAIGHISDILQNTQALGNTDVVPWNATKNFFSNMFGSGAPGRANLNIQAATNELATTFKGSGATDDEIKALGTLDANSSPDQVRQYIEGATQLLGSRLQALTDTYTAGMGKAPTTPFLNQDSVNNLLGLQKAGIDVSMVPGLANSASTASSATPSSPLVGSMVSDASGVPDGATATGSDGKTYVAHGGQWIAQ